MTILLAGFVLVCIACILLHTGFAASHRAPAADGFYCFFEEDDSDIKIAGKEPVKKTDDTLTEVNELEFQRRCGNLEKAHKLGKELSGKIINEDGESNFGQDSGENEMMLMQRRLLLTFAASSTVEGSIKSSVLQGVVLNVFYDSLKKSLPAFYADINESLSFYTLCVRRGGDVQSSVGRTFAMFVDKENDTVMEEFGKALFLRFVDVTLNTIKSFDFKQ